MRNKKTKTKPEPKEYPVVIEKPSVVCEAEAQYGEPINPIPGKIMTLMGLSPYVGYRKVKNDTDLISVIRDGIPKQAMDHLMEISELSITEMAAIVHTSDRTLRRYQPEEKLPQEQSERIVEIAGLYSHGQEIFGSLESFRDWMNTELIPFNFKRPKEFLDTSLGIRLINEELGRIEHGIFA